MSSTEDFTTEKIRYRVDKIQTDLEALEPEVHGTVVALLQQYFNFRAMVVQKQRDEQAKALKEEADRIAKFDPREPQLVRPS